jgi:transposase
VAGYNFIRPNRDQLFLMPPALQDRRPPDDLAYSLLDAVDQFDLTAFYAAYRADGVGQAAFRPHMMVALLLYAYSPGVRPSRQIERLCQRDVAFRIVAGDLRPDRATIARFRQRHAEALEGPFTDILRLCKEAGLVRVGVVALDGTEMAADAASEANRAYESVREEVETMLTEAEAKDVEEDRLHGPERRGGELPEAMRDRGSRPERLRRCRERLEQEAAAAAAEHARELEERAAKEARAGRKLRGREPKPVSEAPEAEAKANVTDPDSRIMKARRGYLRGYNAQAVATADQIIVAADVTADENDVDQLHPMPAAAANELKAAGVEETVKAAPVDAGYCSEENLERADPAGPELFVATRKDCQSEWKVICGAHNLLKLWRSGRARRN